MSGGASRLRGKSWRDDIKLYKAAIKGFDSPPDRINKRFTL